MKVMKIKIYSHSEYVGSVKVPADPPGFSWEPANEILKANNLHPYDAPGVIVDNVTNFPEEIHIYSYPILTEEEEKRKRNKEAWEEFKRILD